MNPSLSKVVRDGLDSIRIHRGIFVMDLLGGRRYTISPEASGWAVQGFRGTSSASRFELLVSADRLYLTLETEGRNPCKVVQDIVPSDVVRVNICVGGVSTDLYMLDPSDVVSNILERMDAVPGSCVCVELDDGNQLRVARATDGWNLSTRAEDGSPVRKDVGSRVVVHGTPCTLEVMWNFDAKDRPQDGIWFEKSSVVAVSYVDAPSAVPRTCWEVPA